MYVIASTAHYLAEKSVHRLYTRNVNNVLTTFITPTHYLVHPMHPMYPVLVAHCHGQIDRASDFQKYLFTI